MRQRPLIGVVAAALFAIIFALRFVVDDPDAPLGLLYGLPVSIVALYFGVRVAVASAALAVALVTLAVVGDLAEPLVIFFSLLFIPYAWLVARVAARMREVVETSREAERNLSELIETVRESFVTLDDQARIVVLNDEAVDLFGWPAEEAIGTDFVETMLAAEPAAEMRRNLALVVAGDEAPWFRHWHDEVEGLHRNGKPLTFELLVAPRRDGANWRFNVFMYDVSERARTWQEHARMAAIVHSSVDAVYSFSTEGTLLSWNPGAERLYGYRADEMIGKPGAAIIPPDRPLDVERLLERVARGELIEDYETVRIEKGGRSIEVALTVTPVADSSGEVIEAAVVARDISEKKRHERYRQAQHRATRLLAEAADPATAVPELTEILGTAMGWPRGVIWYRDGHDLRLRCVDVWRHPNLEQKSDEPCPFEPGEVIELDEPPVPTFTWETVGPGEGVTPGAARAAEAGVRTVVWVPVTIDGTMLGAVELLTRRRLGRDEPAIAMSNAVSSLLTALMRRRYAESEADRLKDEFFGMVSHEMRTPLTSIIGYTELLGDFESEGLSDQGRGFLEVIERNARREMRLVADLLALVRIEAGTFTVEPEAIDLTAIATEAAEAASPRAETGKVSLTANLEKLPSCSGDPHRLGQVIDNLLSNAIKFTPAGGTVELHLAREHEVAVIEVADTGMGIPEAEQERLFDRLYRAKSATEQHIQGLGLGLTIVKAIVEAHGGVVSVSSREGEGTTFRVELPLRPPPESPAAEAGDSGKSTVEAPVEAQ